MGRLRKWTPRVAAGLAGALLLLYLLRWPLLGGLVRSELEQAVAAHLKGTLVQARLSGSLLTSATAEDVRVEGGPDTPVDHLSIRRVTARYGFLGLGRPEIEVEGARVVFVDREPEKPSDRPKTIRVAEKIVRTLKFPGRLTLRDGEITLPDSQRIAIAEAYVDETTLRARGRVPGFGEVEASRDGGVVAARAAEGPVRRARLERTGGAFRFTALVEGHEVEGAGQVEHGPDDVLLRAQAEAVAKIGRARVSADFATGRVEARGELTLEVDDPIRARVTASGHVAGPILGPLRAWKLDDAVASAGRVFWRDLELDDVRVEVPDATLDALTWHATASRGKDRFEGEGSVRGGAIEGELRAAVETSAAYVPGIAATGVAIRGRFRVQDGFRFTGRVETGPGEIEGLKWTSLAGEVAVDPQGVEVPALLVKGLPYAPEARVSGSADFQGPRVAVRARAQAGEDWLQAEGVFEKGRFEGAFSGVAADVRAAGRVVKDPASLRAALEPGEIRGVRHGPLDLRLSDGRVVLAETDVASSGAAGRLSGSIAWKNDRVSGELRLRDIVIQGKSFGAAAATFTRDQDLEIDAAWAVEAGIGAELRGRWGASNDLRLQARVPDLAQPWPRRFLDGLPSLTGALTLDAHVAGSAERPEIEGRLGLFGATVEGGAPFHLEVPLRGEGRRIVIALPATPTPFGRLTLDARLPLPGAGEPLEGRARLEARDLAVFARFLPEAARSYVPEGELDVEASAVGPRWSATAELRVPVAPLPVPFAPLKDVRASGTIDAAGLRIDRLVGRMGGGTFEASLRRESAGPIRGMLRGRELLVIATPLSHIRLSSEVGFSWAQDKPGLIQGTVTVPIALIHEEPGSPGGGGGDLAVGGLRLRPAPGGGVLVPGVRGMDGIQLDLAVSTSGEVRVENSVVGAMLRAKGRLRGTLAEPIADGVVEAKSGEVKLPAAIFVRIEEARVTIPAEAGAEPSAHFVGRVGKGDGSIEVRIDGPLARPELNLASDPPRPKEELLARLAFGHPPGQVQGAALGVFAVRLFEQYTAGWPQAEPKDSLFSRLKPTVLGAEADDPRRAPWQLPSGRTARGMVVRTEYLWTPYFSIVGEADREANVGGDMKLRLRFR
jgi:hypothetical protein